MMPEIAVGITTLVTVFHFGTPSASDASRSSFGMSRSISSLERTTTGVMRTARATAPARPERVPGPNASTKRA
jgi:hypothetical protein